MKKATKIFVIVFIVILFTGFGFYFYQLYEVAKDISLKEASVANVRFEGFNPAIGDFYPDSVEFTFRIKVYNPSSYGITLDKIVYTVYVEEIFLGKEFVENLYIAPKTETSLDFKLKTESSDILSLIGDLLVRGDNVVDYRVNGYIVLPIKFFGVVRVFSVEIPYNYEGFYVLPVKPPWGRPETKLVNGWWESTTIHLCSTVKATVTVKGSISGKMEIQIKKDIPLWPDKVVYSKSFYVNIPVGDHKTFTIHFHPSEASSWKLRGYYIVVKLNNQEIWSQEGSYPPRLKVLR